MAGRRRVQMSLADSLVRRRPGQNERLDRIDQLVDWSPIEAVLGEPVEVTTGRPRYPALQMFKCLLLQQWYGLSDPELEEAVADRLSFKRFVGLALDEAVPDHSTLCRFRQRLGGDGLAEQLLSCLNQQLEAKSLMVRQGTLIDATLVQAQAARPSYPDQGAGGRSPSDPDARWTRKGGRSHFGYKAHVAVDAGSGLIRKALLTSAEVNDTVPADQLICGDEAAVYADQAYDSQARRARLKAAGIKDRIMHRPNKHHPRLPTWKRRRNHLIARTRAPVEAIFGLMKRSYGYRTVRYLRMPANQVQLLIMCCAINLRRAQAIST